MHSRAHSTSIFRDKIDHNFSTSNLTVGNCLGHNDTTNKQHQRPTTHSKWWCFAKPVLDPKLELFRSATLVEIAAGFTGLKEDIWEEIETMANKSAISTTGMSSVEGSAVGSTLSSGGGRGGGGEGGGGGKSSRV